MYKLIQSTPVSSSVSKMEIPRLSRSMRKSTDLDLRRNLRTTDEEKFKLKLWRTKESKSGGVSWKELKTFIQANNDQKTSTAINSSLHKLWSLTREIFGTEDNAQIIDDAAIFILRLFLNVKTVMFKQLHQMKIMFRNICTEKVMKMCSAVSEISPLLNKECQKYLEISEDKKSTSLPIWGAHISCTIPEPIRKDIYSLQNLCPNLPESSKTAITFSMKYDHKKYIEKQQMISEKDILYTRPWLCKRMNPSHVDNLVKLLKSKISTDKLQNDLFELLGFGKFEIIQEIVQHRKEIVEKFEKFELKNHIKNQLLSKQKKQQEPQVTHIASNLKPQVTHIASNFVVQSEQERQLLKQVKKDEKKLNKLINTVQKELDADEHQEEINPIILRNFQKQTRLQVPSTKPIYKHKSLR